MPTTPMSPANATRPPYLHTFYTLYYPMGREVWTEEGPGSWEEHVQNVFSYYRMCSV